MTSLIVYYDILVERSCYAALFEY